MNTVISAGIVVLGVIFLWVILSGRMDAAYGTWHALSSGQIQTSATVKTPGIGDLFGGAMTPAPAAPVKPTASKSSGPASVVGTLIGAVGSLL